MLRPQFARQQVADLQLEEIHVQDMFKHLVAKGGWTEYVDLVPLFFRLTLDSATEFLFGQSVSSSLYENLSCDWSTFRFSYINICVD